MTIQTPPTTSLLNDQFVDMKFITQFTGLTDKWFYKLIQDGEFPKPIKLGRSSRWLKSEVEQWLQARIDESRGGNFALGS
ncbi:helix-turn-helix transcriptional regulator [Providencia stuartii]|uniref:helix-turn-helix transcriptional regulator n=1 Tax=Providencia stuartii TaxID=588 RepID=UPI002885EDD7|nr:AlpA family transcriptional regulator [Providencia stuartii]MDT1067783.1 AlpA family transcriptional regulator [Providencia stuartii]